MAMVLSFKSPRRMVHRADVVIDDQLTPVHIDEIRGINPARENFRVELPDGLIGTSGQYFKPGDYKKFDAFQSKKVKLPVKDVLSFKMSDELDDIVYTRQKRKAGRKPAGRSCGQWSPERRPAGCCAHGRWPGIHRRPYS